MSSHPESFDFVFEGGRASFTTRHTGGQGRGTGAAELLASKLGVSAIVRLQQVHGDRVVLVPESAVCTAQGPPGDPQCFLGDGDALVTDRRDVAVAVVTADCVPVILVDRKGRGAAAVHGGWRGVAAGIIFRSVQTLEKTLDISPADLDALLGPAAGGCCYEVGIEVVDALRAGARGLDDSDWIRPGSAQNPHVDLRRLVAHQLETAGLEPAAIRISSDCTICRGDLWPSYRREGGMAGRIWAAVVAEGS